MVLTLKTFRWVALIEATTFLAPAGRDRDQTQRRRCDGVSILGPIHGAFFIAYVINVFAIRADQGWSTKVTCWILLGAVLPFGGYVVDWWLARERRVAA